MYQASQSNSDAHQESTEDQTIQYERIIELLTELSSDKNVPYKSYRPTKSVGLSAEIFSNGIWLSELINVQAWLHLSEEIPPNFASENLIGAAQRFFQAAGVDRPETLYVTTDDGLVLPTSDGIAFIEDLLNTADSAREFYALQIEEGETERAATRAWDTHWEELEALKVQKLTDPIRAVADVWSIGEFTAKAEREQPTLILDPSYQRGDVWATSDAQKLIHSILQSIPLPSVILLKKKDAKTSLTTHEVVDGKQRITAILRFIGYHPTALAKVKAVEAKLKQSGEKDWELLRYFLNDYPEFMTKWKNATGEVITDKVARENYFPFKLASRDIEPLFAKKYYTQIKHLNINVGDNLDSVESVFTKGASPYKIPIIEYTQSTPAQIHHVFHLYNKQGKHLNAEEIRNAVFHDVQLLKLLHALSGDSTQLEALAPYLARDEKRRDYPKKIGENLKGYNFGTSRFKRTKALCWLMAAALRPSYRMENGVPTPSVRATSKIIDDFLESLQKQEMSHPLNSDKTLLALSDELNQCIQIHADLSDQCFPSKFVGNQGWDELQLIGTLLGFFFICTSTSDPERVLYESVGEIRGFLEVTNRPEKAQNKTQWEFIARVALGIVKRCGLDLANVDGTLTKKYGSSSVANTLALYAPSESK